MSESELVSRVEQLERDNRRLKRLGAAVLVLVAALGAIYAARPVPEKITAHEFDVMDSTGRLQIRMGTPHTPNAWPSITLFGQDGKADAVIGRGGLTFYGAKGEVASLTTAGGAGLALLGVKPGITVQDSQGFEMDLGTTQTIIERTGQTQNSSADSIIMFGNDKEHHVVWQAP